jgi:hypothetical protein
MSYWTSLTESLYHLPTEAAVSVSSVVKYRYTLQLRRNATTVNSETRLSSIAMLTINEPCTYRFCYNKLGGNSMQVSCRETSLHSAGPCPARVKHALIILQIVSCCCGRVVTNIPEQHATFMQLSPYELAVAA